MSDSEPDPILAVDLDGSVLATDSLWESFFALVRSRPWLALRVPSWLAAGRAAFKARVGAAVELDPACLPYNEPVIAFLREARTAGRQVILATAADRRIAERIAQHLGCFTAVLASDGRTNLRGAQKLQAIEAYAGERGFDYVGNSKADLPIWRAARSAIMVSPSDGVRRRAMDAGNVSRQFPGPRRWRAGVRALRPHQWTKNLLLFVPILAAHKVDDWAALWSVLLGTVAWSVVASAGYLVNDVLDLNSDRRHPVKRSRPLASGDLAIPHALGVAAVLLMVVAALVLRLPGAFSALLLAYLALSMWYSAHLKRVAIVDVLVLSGFYTMRVIAGGAAAGVEVSPWLLAFATFLFLSLAFLKRFAELTMYQENHVGRVPGRDYSTADLDFVRAVGPSSGYMAVLVLALYLNSERVITLYQRPALLWLVSPLLLYWITRLWFLGARGQVRTDPVVFALKDRASYVVGALALTVALLAV